MKLRCKEEKKTDTKFKINKWMRNANGGNESMKVNILNEEEIQYWTG